MSLVTAAAVAAIVINKKKVFFIVNKMTTTTSTVKKQVQARREKSHTITEFNYPRAGPMIITYSKQTNERERVLLHKFCALVDMWSLVALFNIFLQT